MKDDIKIRAANVSDRSVIIDLLKQIDLLADDILAPDTKYWVAESKDHSLIGSAGLEFGSDSALLRSVAVLPDFRKAGLGLQLVNTAIAYARDRNCKSVFLFSTRSGKYWQKLGFRQVPMDELVAAIPEAPQVLRFISIGKLATETAWKKDLTWLPATHVEELTLES